MTSKADDDVIDNTSLESLPIVHLGSCCCATKSTSSSTEEGMEAYDEGLLPAKRSGDRKRIGILGTGDYARAMSKRLLFSGYDVILGSRSPAARQRALYDNCLCGVQMMSLDDCISQCDVLVAAIHMENFKTTLAPRAEILSDKIVIDVSNRINRYSAVSNAEFLQSLIPASMVVKAFNSVSAYAMEDQTTVRNNRVFVCSNDPTARERVMDLARDLGFGPCDMGGLKAARNLEASILKVFPGWKIPLLFAFGVFNLWAVYCAFMYFVERTAYRWDQIFLKVLNKPLSMTAITVLTLTYLPGSVAGIVQLYRGTKYRRFPRWLNAWLVSRRQLGLIALALVMVHALASAMMLSPTYYSSWYHQPSVVIPANVTEQMTIKLQPAWMVWKGELACLFGLAALLLLSLVGVVSLPSVSASLNWAEWRLIQSKIGIMALFLAVAHVVAMGAPGWAKGGVDEDVPLHHIPVWLSTRCDRASQDDLGIAATQSSVEENSQRLGERFCKTPDPVYCCFFGVKRVSIVKKNELGNVFQQNGKPGLHSGKRQRRWGGVLWFLSKQWRGNCSTYSRLHLL